MRKSRYKKLYYTERNKGKLMEDIPKLEYDDKRISAVDFEGVPVFNQFQNESLVTSTFVVPSEVIQNVSFSDLFIYFDKNYLFTTHP